MGHQGVTASSGQRLRHADSLARNALGTREVVFLIATATSPLAAVLFDTPVAVRGSGIGAAAVFWVVTLVLLVFSIGYVAMARQVTTAGGFYSFASHGFGRVIGLGVAMLVVFTYLSLVIGVIGITAFFANTTVSSLLHVTIDWRVYAYALIVIMFLLGYFRVSITAKILGVLLIGELIVLAVFSIAVLLHSHLSLTPLSPSQISGSSAKEVFAPLGGAAVGAALFGAFFSWTGFEMAPNYGEEAREPRRTMAVATYLTVIGIGLIGTFLAWVLIVGYGGTKAVPAVAASFYGIDPAHNAQLAGLGPNANLSSVFYPLAQKGVGNGLVDVMEVLVITSAIAAGIAFWNTASRYLFAMGREGILPAVFGRTHPRHRSPYLAAVCVLVVSVIVVTIFATGASGTFSAGNPLTALTNLGTWLPFQGVLALIVVEAIVSLAIVAFFRRRPLPQEERFRTLRVGIAPIVAAVCLGYVAIEMIKNRAQLAGASGYVSAIPYYGLAAFAIGVILALIYRYAAADRYEAIGRFVHDDVDEITDAQSEDWQDVPGVSGLGEAQP